MVHNEHNRPRKSGGFFLIIFGALLFILAPILFGQNSRDLGMAAIVFGFLVGGLGFYLNYIKKKR